MSDGGGPAFPVPEPAMSFGMQLRDVFAAVAMSALIQSTRVSVAREDIVVEAYRYADAMLEART